MKLTEAKKEYLEAILERGVYYGREHPETIEALDCLSLFCVNIHDCDAAERHTKDALERRKLTLPHDHNNVLDTMSNLAKIYKLQNKWKECGEVFKECLRLETEKTNDQSPTIIPYAINLASYYRIKKKYNKAEDLYYQCLNILNQISSPPEWSNKTYLLLQVKNNLANLHYDQNHFIAAEGLYIECINDYSVINSNSMTIEKLQFHINLAMLYCNQSKLFPTQDGILLFDKCIKLGIELLGPDHILIKQWSVTKDNYIKNMRRNQYCILS